MAFAYQGGGALDYYPCRYGNSKLLFRGPRRNLDAPFCAIFGGSEAYGKFVPKPFPDLVEEQTGCALVNLSCMNAGLDVYLNDPTPLEIAARAQAVVVQVTGATNLTNRLYSVHPRRNDRFVSASPILRSMYREVDFADFTFTRHMIQTLYSVSPDRFVQVTTELRAAWIARMRTLLERIPVPTVLLWISDRAPPTPGMPLEPTQDPLLVDAGMIAAVRPHASHYLEVIVSDRARDRGVEGMSFSPLDAPVAAEVPGPAVHEEIAAALGPVLLGLV